MTVALASRRENAAPYPRLAICAAGEIYGGVERHILSYGRWLKESGLDPVIVLFHDRELADQLRGVGLQPTILPTRSSLDVAAGLRLGDMFSAQDVRIVHAHGYRAVVNCGLASRRHRVLLVRTVHGMVEPTARPSFGALRSRVYTWLEQFWGRRASAVVTYVSDDLRLRHERLDRGLRTTTIHNGIYPLDRSEYPVPEEWDAEGTNLIVLGRLSTVKGIDVLLEALRGLRTDKAWTVSIVGTGPLADQLRSLSVEWGLGDRVRFLGFRRDAYRFLANAQALLIPSHHEGLPYTVLEAMSLGVPILASAVGGMAEVLADGQTARLFPAGNVDRLREAIGEALSSSDRMREMATAAQLDFSRRFRIDVMGQAYLDLYASLAKDPE